jgi:hypothetical protein
VFLVHAPTARRGNIGKTERRNVNPFNEDAVTTPPIGLAKHEQLQSLAA